MNRREFMAALGRAGGVAAWALPVLAEALPPPEPATRSEAYRPPDLGGEDALAQAVQALATVVTESAAAVRRHPLYADERSQAPGMMFWGRMLLWALQQCLNGDLDFPYFRVVDFNVRPGGDNPDQRYLMAEIRGGERYRLWGAKGTERRLDFQVYAGTPWNQGAGRSAAVLVTEDLHVAPDGGFEITVSPERAGSNWLENPRDGTSVLVRQIFSDWRTEVPGEVHIDRIGYEGQLKPAATAAEVAHRITAVAEQLRLSCSLWPDYFLNNVVSRQTANTISPPRDPGAQGGRPGRLASHGTFELADDEALVVTMWPTTATYQGIQLMDVWMASLEYANRQTSLTADQAYRSADGAYRFVIAHRDPGVPNWLDTTGLRHGGILIRYDGLRGPPLSPPRMPVARKVKLTRLRRSIPNDTPALTPAQREATIRERRRHVQRRFNL